MRESKITRDEAFELLKKYNKDPFHIRHALTVEGVMRWYAKELGYADEEEYWAIVGLLHELFQPCLFDVVLELNAERAVVPAVGQTAVDLGACEDKTTVFAEGNDLVHGLFTVFHHSSRPPDVNDQGFYPIIIMKYAVKSTARGEI